MPSLCSAYAHLPQITHGCYTSLVIMPIKLYNSLSRKEEELQPIEPGKIGMYSCGPTVYNYAHIGNLRTFVFEDVLRRTLRANGLEVKQVKNITDVDDKTIRGSQQAGMSLQAFTQKYTEEFFTDIDALHIQRAEVYPKATEHIAEMIVMIETLIAKDLAYVTSDGVYFSIEKFPHYGELAHLDLEGMQAGASGRVLKDEYEKDNVADFALWKFWSAEDGEAKWEAPFGAGRPGWHIECSAMSEKYLGPSFDIHTGGIDLLFPHHQDELAQSEGCFDKPFVRHWLHAEHLLVDGKKMSKSLGNFYTLRDIIAKGFDPLALRYLFLSATYRTKLNFTWEALTGAQNALHKLRSLARSLPLLSAEGAEVVGTEHEKAFLEALNNDLNTPQALAVVWNMLNDASLPSSSKAESLLKFDRVLGLGLEAHIGRPIEVPQEILTLVDEREAARQAKDWKRSDELRDLIATKGFTVEDTPDGQKIS